MEIISSVIDFPKSYGEDIIFFNDKYIGVIDGSTPIDKQEFKGYNTQAEWFANMLGNRLNELNSLGITDNCKKVIEEYKEDEDILRLEEYNKPCVVLAGIEESEELKLTIIGDCLISVLFKDGSIKTYKDERITEFSERTKNEKAKAINKGEDISVYVKRQMIINRGIMNTVGGFWTVSFKNNFEEGVITEYIDKNTVDKILIYSDGYERLFKLSDVGLDDMFSLNVSLEEGLRILRGIEDSLTLSNNKEVKTKDDACAVLISIEDIK